MNHCNSWGIINQLDVTDIKFTKEEQELLDMGMQYNLQQTGKNSWTNLIVETEQALRQLEVKMQDAYRILAAKKLISNNKWHQVGL